MTTPAHLGGSHVHFVDGNTWMPDVWEYLIDRFRARSVLDVGCGSAFSTEWFRQRGLHAVGIEGDPAAIRARRIDTVFQHDFATGPLHLVERYDLGWCAEFVEHVEAQYMPNWMACLQRCRYACITFAHPGQGGHHHVNEQTHEYWVEKFRGFNFDHMPEETARLRSTSRGETWGRPSLTVFVNRGFGEYTWKDHESKQQA